MSSTWPTRFIKFAAAPASASLRRSTDRGVGSSAVWRGSSKNGTAAIGRASCNSRPLAAPARVFQMSADEHQHLFLGSGHAANERKAWAVIVLCSAMMLIEIGGGITFGSLALVADGLHMSTHAIAMLIAALAYTFARKHAADARFSFGTGKVGDLAGFSSAIVLALIAVLIGYEAVVRLLAPVPISFREAIPIACLGLIVNVVSAWLLSGGDDHHHGHGAVGDANGQNVDSRFGTATIQIAEAEVPPRFRLRIPGGGEHA